jgi:hypothetical protein
MSDTLTPRASVRPTGNRIYDPHVWYWLADDGRIFAGATESIVAADDPAYVAWSAAGVASQWPRDTTGAQTDAALQDVIGPYGMFANLNYYTASKRWQKEQAGITLASGMPIKTDDRAQAKITGVYSAQQEQPAVVTPWHAADGTIWQLDAGQIQQMNFELLTHINNCFSISADALAGIADGTITTRDQIDVIFDAPITQSRKDWLRG